MDIPDNVRKKLEERTFWVFVTLNADGSPTSSPLWVHVDERHILVNTATGRRKERNVRRDPRVSLSTFDCSDPYSWIEIRGRVAEIVEGEDADESFYDMARKYLGYAASIPDTPRVLLRIEPTKINFRTEPRGDR